MAHGDVNVLLGLQSGGAVDFSGGGGGEEGRCSIAQVKLGRQAIAAHHSASGVKHDHLATSVRVLEGALDSVGSDRFRVSQFCLGVLTSED